MISLIDAAFSGSVNAPTNTSKRRAEHGTHQCLPIFLRMKLKRTREIANQSREGVGETPPLKSITMCALCPEVYQDSPHAHGSSGAMYSTSSACAVYITRSGPMTITGKPERNLCSNRLQHAVTRLHHDDRLTSGKCWDGWRGKERTPHMGVVRDTPTLTQTNNKLTKTEQPTPPNKRGGVRRNVNTSKTEDVSQHLPLNMDAGSCRGKTRMLAPSRNRGGKSSRKARPMMGGSAVHEDDRGHDP